MKITDLQKRADKWFSRFVRLRDVTHTGYGKCITCGLWTHFRMNAECGHYVKRRHLETRYDERNCYLQCIKCNREDNVQLLGTKIDEIHGFGTAKELDATKGNHTLLTRDDYKDIIKTYRSKAFKLMHERGLFWN